MAADRARRRAFQPTLDGQLESRFLLSRAGIRQSTPARPGLVGTQTANGGRAVNIVDVDGELYVINLQGGGTVRAQARRGGLVDLIVEGSNPDSELTINPKAHPIRRGTAHQFPRGARRNDGLLHIGGIRVDNGQIGSILGYRTADLSGPILVRGTSSVDRIAFAALRPGASIEVGGDLDTLEVLNGANLSGGFGIRVGRDLNVINVGQDLVLSNGAAIDVGRDLGAINQAARGSGLGGQGGTIFGNLVVGEGSSIVVRRNVFVRIFVRGNVFGIARIMPREIVFTPISQVF